MDLFFNPWLDAWKGLLANDPLLFFPGLFGVAGQMLLAFALFTIFKESEWWYLYHRDRDYWAIMHGSHRGLQLDRYKRFMGCAALAWIESMLGILVRLMDIGFVQRLMPEEFLNDRGLRVYIFCAIAGFAAFLLFRYMKHKKSDELDEQSRLIREKIRRRQDLGGR